MRFFIDNYFFKFNMVIFDYNNLNITSGGIQYSKDQNIISILICGNDAKEEKGFMHLFTYDFISNQKNDTYFSYFNYCISRKISRVIFPKNATEDNSIYFTDACLKTLNRSNWETEITTEEVYDKLQWCNCISNQPILIGMNNRTGLAIIDLNKENTSNLGGKMIYPGKKNLINDFIIGDDRIVLCSDDNKVSYFDMRE